ncbi:F-box protein At5g49610-like [Aristolochia californica]|uniref:F-box protein At5g49610-like n=1 Tax=Aristolochia californica TaxID=171875 RepID=UPI0035DEF797
MDGVSASPSAPARYPGRRAKLLPFRFHLCKSRYMQKLIFASGKEDRMVFLPIASLFSCSISSAQREKMNPSGRKSLVKSPEISSLNDDVLTDILTRLPLRPLQVSKCVSKKWYGLLAGVPLTKQICLPTGIFTCEDTGKWGYSSRTPVDEYEEDLNEALDISLSFLPCFPNGVVLAGSNGLLLCADQNETWGNFFVCNPLTKKWREVPRPEVTDKGPIYSVALDFNPNVSPYFKIIFYQYKHKRHLRPPVMRPLEMELEIFSSELGKWISSEVTEWASATCSYTHMISLNGVVYKLMNPDHLLGCDRSRRPNNVQVQEIQLPVAAANASYGSIGQAAGSLYYSYGDADASTVWVLKDSNTNEWELKHRISLTDFSRLAERDLGPGDWVNIVYQPMVFLSDHELVFLEELGGAVIYDCNQVRFKRMEIRRRHEITSVRFKAFPFTPCLNDPSIVPPPVQAAME